MHCWQLIYWVEQRNPSDAQSFLLSMSQFSFIITLVATQNVLSYTKGLSIKLQGPYVDVAQAHREVCTLKSSLKRLHQDLKFSLLHPQTIAWSVGVEECTPRLASRQWHRENIPAQDPIDYYHFNLTISLLSMTLIWDLMKIHQTMFLLVACNYL